MCHGKWIHSNADPRIMNYFAVLALTICTVFAADAPPTLQTFEQWQHACDPLPSNISLRGQLPPKRLLPLQSFREFDDVLVRFLQLCTSGALSRSSNWVGQFPERSGFFDTNRTYFKKTSLFAESLPFSPFAEKVSVPVGSEVYLHADFHGDVRSLMEDLKWLNSHGYLNGFTASRTNFYMVFLGDYTDRGSYGIEVLYTLFRLKLANPDLVFLNRGNHEEVSIQSRYGFLREGRGKYGNEFDPVKLLRAYDFLPVVTYLGSGDDFIQCNHGGMEPGFQPGELLASEGPTRFQLIGRLTQQRFATQNPNWLTNADAGSRKLAAQALRDFTPEDPISPSVLGFMWNDFSLLSTEPQFAFDPGRAFVYGEKSTQYLLGSAGAGKQKVHAVFRGHQQAATLNPIMRRIIASRGIYRHWQTADSSELLNAPIEKLAEILETGASRAIPSGSVWTFNVAPDSVYGQGCDFNFDTFGILKVAPKFPDWRLEVFNIPQSANTGP